MNFEHPGPAEARQLLMLWKTVFGEYDGFWELFLDTTFLPDHCRCVTENGQVLGGLYWFDCSCGRDKIAYIYAVATDPSHRGRGLCRKLIPALSSQHCALLRQLYDERYPRRDRMPVQKEVYRLLKKGSKAE